MAALTAAVASVLGVLAGVFGSGAVLLRLRRFVLKFAFEETRRTLRVGSILRSLLTLRHSSGGILVIFASWIGTAAISSGVVLATTTSLLLAEVLDETVSYGSIPASNKHAPWRRGRQLRGSVNGRSTLRKNFGWGHLATALTQEESWVHTVILERGVSPTQKDQQYI